MALRPTRKEKEHVISEIYKAIQKGELKVSPEDVRLITDPEHLALYEFVDTFYQMGKTVEIISKYFKRTKE